MNKWIIPVPLRLVTSHDPESFKSMKPGETALPLLPHPGAFGAQRLHHRHEGIDLYCPEGTPVMAVEDGVVVLRQDFTGEKAGSPWWHDTEALLIEGESGVVVYGEIAAVLKMGDRVQAGQEVGKIVQVLKEDKGRPMSMLHLELHVHGTRDTYEWKDSRPSSLHDPTMFLQMAVPCGS